MENKIENLHTNFNSSKKERDKPKNDKIINVSTKNLAQYDRERERKIETTEIRTL